MAPNQTLTFTNKTGFFSSKRRIVFTLLTFCFFAGIVGLCAYQLTYGESGSTWASPFIQDDQIQDDFRLPKSLIPVYYKLDLIPYLNPADGFKIDGVAEIHMRCNEPTDRITVNIKNMTIEESRVHVWDLVENGNGTRLIEVVGHAYEPSKDFYHVLLGEHLLPGSSYGVYIAYLGTLNDELVGFYRTSYTDMSSNETRYFVTEVEPFFIKFYKSYSQFFILLPNHVLDGLE